MKHFLTLLLLIICTSTVVAQDYYVVTAFESKERDPISREYQTVKKYNPTRMFVKIVGNLISINDDAGSRYKTYGPGSESNGRGYKSYDWPATDEKQRPCEISIAFYPQSKGTVLFVFYHTEGFMLSYAIEAVKD